MRLARFLCLILIAIAGGLSGANTFWLIVLCMSCTLYGLITAELNYGVSK